MPQSTKVWWRSRRMHTGPGCWDPWSVEPTTRLANWYWSGRRRHPPIPHFARKFHTIHDYSPCFGSRKNNFSYLLLPFVTCGLPPFMFPRCLGWVAVIDSDAKQGTEPASWWSLLYLRQTQPWSRTARVTWRPSNMGWRIVGIKEVSTSLVTFTFSYIQVEQNLQLCYITYPWKRMNACKSPSLCVAGAPSESWCGAPLCSGERENLCGQLIGYKLLRSGEGSFYGNKLFTGAKLGFVSGAFRSRNVGSRLVETAEVRAKRRMLM